VRHYLNSRAAKICLEVGIAATLTCLRVSCDCCRMEQAFGSPVGWSFAMPRLDCYEYLCTKETFLWKYGGAEDYSLTVEHSESQRSVCMVNPCQGIGRDVVLAVTDGDWAWSLMLSS